MKTLRFIHTLTLLALVSLLFTTTAIAAPPQPNDCATEAYNLLASKNCSFETSVPDANWEASQSYVTIAQSNEQVHNGDYALKVTGTSSWTSGRQGAQTVKASNPIPITGGNNYTFAAWVYIPSTATRVTNASLRIAWYTASDCSGSQLSTNTADISNIDVWTYGSITAPAPTTATCAQARLMINVPSSPTGTVGPVYFDNALFYPSNPNAVITSTLGARTLPYGIVFSLPLLGLLVLSGAALYRRRRNRAL